MTNYDFTVSGILTIDGAFIVPSDTSDFTVTSASKVLVTDLRRRD